MAGTVEILIGITAVMWLFMMVYLIFRSKRDVPPPANRAPRNARQGSADGDRVSDP